MQKYNQLLEILRHDTLSLPVKYNESFRTEVDSKLIEYKGLLENYPRLFGSEEMNTISGFIDGLLLTLDNYLKGQPSLAFNQFSAEVNKMTGYLRVFSYDVVGKSGDEPLFRMRVGNNHSLTRKEMFHIPFELRGKAATQRYSIPGLPSLYLGSSSYICWEELYRPDLNTVNTTRAKMNSDVRYLDFGLTPGVFSEILEETAANDPDRREMYERVLKAYAMCWPLLACCSIKVKNRSDAFKPEYIISQLLLQWITSESDYSGICYFSVNIEQNKDNYQLTQNFVFPVKSFPLVGYCEELRGNFELTRSVPWQVYQLNHPGLFVGTPSTKKMGICEGDNSYELTQFGKLEQYLAELVAADIMTP